MTLTRQKIYTVVMCHLGNGLSVSNAAEERHGDYVRLALIQADRSIGYREPNLPDDVRAQIEHAAFTSSAPVSFTQPGSVFSTPPLGEEVYTLHTNGNHEQCRRPECTVTTNPPALTTGDIYGVISAEKEGRTARPARKARTRFSILRGGRWHRVYANTHIARDALFIVHEGHSRYLDRRAADTLAAAGYRADRTR